MALPFKFKSKTLLEEGRTTQSAIDEITSWLKTTSLPQLQEEFIALFLASCLNDIAATQKTIQAYFRIKNGAPEIFNNCDLDLEDLKKAIQVMYFCVIPTRMNDNSVICLTKLNNTNYRDFDGVSYVKLWPILLHFCQICDPPNGLVAVIDSKGFGFMHLTRVKIGVIKTLLEYVQEGLPLRIRQIHLLNTSYVIEKLLSLIKIFIKSDLMESIITHPSGIDLEQFHKEYIPAPCLPKELDGDLPSIDELSMNTMEQIRQFRSFYQAEEKLRNYEE